MIGDLADNSFTGAAWVYTFSPGAGWTEQQTLTGSAGGRELGTSVAVNGDEVIVGAPGDNGGEGAAYVYMNNAGSWAPAGMLTIPNTNGTPLPSQVGFGDSVGTDGPRPFLEPIHP